MKLEDLNAKPDEDVAPNLMPLIDVVFILLIFFMVTSTFSKDQALAIERPQSTTATTVDEKTLNINYEASGRLSISGRELALWALESEVREALESKVGKKVILTADADISAQNLVRVIDRCKQGGAESVALSVDVRR